MADNNLDRRIQQEPAQLPQQKPGQQAPPTETDDLEAKIDDDTPVGLAGAFSRFSLWDWTKIGGLAAASGYYVAQIMNPFAAVLNVGSQLVSYVVGHYVAMKNKISKNNLLGEIQLGNVMTPILTSLFKAISFIPQWWAKIGAGLAVLPAMVGMYTFLSHPIRNYKFSEAVKNLDQVAEESLETVKKNFWPVTGRILAVGLPFYSLNVNFIPVEYQLPVASALRPFQRTFIRKGETIDYKNANDATPLEEKVDNHKYEKAA